MYTGTLILGSGADVQDFRPHPAEPWLVIGEKDNLIYQLVDELPETVICAYDLGEGCRMFANYAEDGEYRP